MVKKDEQRILSRKVTKPSKECSTIYFTNSHRYKTNAILRFFVVTSFGIFKQIIPKVFVPSSCSNFSAGQWRLFRCGQTFFFWLDRQNDSTDWSSEYESEHQQPKEFQLIMTKLSNENTNAHQFLNDRLIVFRKILSVASFFFASLHIFTKTVRCSLAFSLLISRILFSLLSCLLTAFVEWIMKRNCFNEFLSKIQIQFDRDAAGRRFDIEGSRHIGTELFFSFINDGRRSTKSVTCLRN